MAMQGEHIQLGEEPEVNSQFTTDVTTETSSHDTNLEFTFGTDPAFVEKIRLVERSGKLAAVVEDVSAITAANRRDMWALYSSYYDGATWDSFNADLDEKTHVIMARDSADNSIQGFSTIKKFSHEVDGVKMIVLYSGDTIVHPDYWGQKAVHLAFFSYVMKLRFANPVTKIFWFLLCNGFRTYLTFARNLPAHWPRYDRATPAWEQRVLNSLAELRFGADFDAKRGIVKFKNSLGLLKPNVAPIGENELKDPAVRFLVEKNPGYVNGDELCCMAEITLSLFLIYPLKLVKKSLAALVSPRPARARGVPQ